MAMLNNRMVYDYDGVTCNGESADEPLDFWNLRLYLRQLHSEQLPVSGWGFMLHFPTRAAMWYLFAGDCTTSLGAQPGISVLVNQVLFTESWVVTQGLSEMTPAYQLTIT